MHNAIFSEIRKLKKNKMAWAGTWIVVLMPLLLILKSIFLDRQRGVYSDWFMTVSMIHMLVFPVVSGFVVTTMVQKEYQDKTLRNILTAPTSRESFVIAKLSVWFLWYLLTLCLTKAVVAAGYFFLFPEEFSAVTLRYTLYLFTQGSIFSFVQMIPVLWIAFRQQGLFYPSMLVTLGVTALQAAGRQVSEDLLLPACICPQTAVSVSGMVEFGSFYFRICTVSVFLCGFLGFIGALLSFKRQDQ